MMEFTFVQTVSKAEVKRRAELLEAQAGFLPWFDWTDFVDKVQDELVGEFKCDARRLNLRAHRIEKDQSAPALEVRFICSFANEIDMVVFKVAVA
jgi:hypothetical protein